MAVSTHVPSTTSCIISGYELKGWNTITVSRNAPVFTQVRGIRGKSTRVNNKDTTATITFDVYQTEIANGVFSTALNLDAQYGSIRFEIMIKNSSNRSVFSTTTAYVSGYPDLVLDGDLKVNRWVLFCEESTIHISGAESPTPGIVENGISKLANFVDKVSDIF
jgi:hypothetical protein